MRQDQIDRLQDLSESIADVFIDEADPQNWNGSGNLLCNMEKDERGNRLFDKKNAIQTGTLLARVLDLRDRDSRSVDAKTPEDDAEKEIERFEKQARELIDAVASKR